VPGDLRPRRHVAQLGQGIASLLLDEPGDGQPIVGEIIGLEGQILWRVRIQRAVRALPLPDFALRIFRRQRTLPDQQTLSAVGEAVCLLEERTGRAVPIAEKIEPLPANERCG
jgi:hypothetical protein